MFDRAKAGQLARDVIVKYIESGYYHPKMYNEGAKGCNGGRIPAYKFQPLYRISGETMFGQDRTAGHDIFYSTPQPKKIFIPRGKYSAPDPFQDVKYIEANAYKYANEMAKEFWTTIDKADAKNNWCWGYMGGKDQNRLMFLAGQIMYDEFVKSFLKYFPKEIQEGIHNDDALASNVFYTTWNGTGWRDKYITTYKALSKKNPPKNTADINRLFLQARKLRDGKIDSSGPMAKAVKNGLGVNIYTYNKSASNDIADAEKKKSSNPLVLGISYLQRSLLTILQKQMRKNQLKKRRFAKN